MIDKKNANATNIYIVISEGEILYTSEIVRWEQLM